MYKIAAALMLAALPAGLSAQGALSLTLPEQAPGDIFKSSRTKEALVAQVLLDRSRHSPGVIDGIMGGNTARAIKAFQRANGMKPTGELTSGLLRKLLAQHSGDIVERYKITTADASGPFIDVPDDMAAKAKLDRLAYESPAEALAEKFHMAKSFLEALNPGVDFGQAGTEITVIKVDDKPLQPDVARIEVDKASSSVRAYASDGKLVATYPATVGSSTFPSPSGTMKVKAVAAEPKYYFDPSGRKWGPDEKLTIAAGPNNPVGSTWIDLSKEGYGIHGSPDPRLIGKTASHGCVRLTNWDAEELGKAVKQGAVVKFV